MRRTPGIPISHAKICVPVRRHELITRSRLMDELFNQIDRRLLFVVAPAGYGKTSLLVDLAQQSEIPFCWLSLDALDQEPQRFLRYLIAAISERFPSFGQDSLLALESMSSFANDEERLLVTITNEINIQIRDHFVLVLDDFHLVADAKMIGQMISRFLQLVGENVHLIISSRYLPDLPEAPLWIARNQVGGVTFEDLSFQPDEIQQLFQQNNGIVLTRKDAETLVKETEGWIAAIHLTNGNPGTLPQLRPLENTSTLFDFFSREVMQRQPEDVRRFILLTSVFDAFDISLCEKVLGSLPNEGDFNWPILFETVRTSNLFSISLDNEGRWMRYHHLFQHYLRSQIQYENPVLAWQIQQNLAHAYEEQQEWEEALQIYDHLKDHQNQIRLLIQTGMIFIGSGRILTLSNWLNKLPMDLAYSQPALLSLLGTVHTTQGENRQALELFNQAEGKLRDTGNLVEWTATLVRRAEVYRQIGQYDLALKDVDNILEVARGATDYEMQSIFAEAQRIKGLALVGLGQVKDSLTWLEDSLRNYKLLGIKNSVPILETELGVVHRRLGEPEITARYYSSALQSLESSGNTGWKARLLNNMGMLQYMTGNLEEAYSLFQSALQTAERCGYVRIQANVLISIGDLLTDLNQFDSAFIHYDKALTLATQIGHSLYIFYSAIGEARLKRMGGNTALAIEELRQAEISQTNLGSFERALYNLDMGRCLLENDEIQAATILFKEAVDLFGKGGNQMEQAIARLWLNAAISIESPQEAIEQLREFLPPQREWQKSSPLMIHAGQAARWLKSKGVTRLLRESILRLFFEQAVRVSGSLPELAKKLVQPTDQVKSSSPRLEIFSFGDVQVHSHQQVVEISDWQTREARDLFLFLLQSPPKTKEQIALEFWPDISKSRLKIRFKINIYRIRQALGQDVILFKDDRYSFNHSIHYTWDREDFEKAYHSSQQKAAILERTKLLERAVSLIDRGQYLANVDAEWAVADRLKYQDLYQEAMLKLANIYLQKEQPRECLLLARKILLIDPLLEDGHRLVIQACAELHDSAGLTLQYRKYQQIRETELGLQPSHEMSTLYKQLLNKI
ncbi:MAG: tetratricopeptide repeat protein [Anaerolineales bacterium]